MTVPEKPSEAETEKRADVAETKCVRALDRASELQADLVYLRSLLGWLKKKPAPDGEGDEAFPADFVIGTPANPLLLHRVYDSHLGDSAHFATLDSLMPRVLP